MIRLIIDYMHKEEAVCTIVAYTFICWEIGVKSLK